MVLATGRMTTSALPYARELGLRAPLIGLQGALVREMPAPGSARLGRLLLHRPLPADVAHDAIAWCRAVGLTPHVNHLEKMVVPESDQRADDYSGWNLGRVLVVPDLDAWIRGPVTKIISVATPPLPDASLERGPGALRRPRRPDREPPHVPGVPRPGRRTRARAVRYLARRLGVDLRDALAIGDQRNDAEMIAEVGMGVAMAGAPDAVRAVARLIAPPLAEEGAAQVIEELVLGGRPA